MALIKHREVVADDPWQYLGDDAAPSPRGDVIVGLSRWQRERADLLGRPGRVGVRLASGDELDPILADLGNLAVVALEFPRFTDGRAYSKARLLRDRHGYAGEIRAVGNVLPDQMFYMARCGIDAFELQDGKSPQAALAALETWSVTYQAAADDPRPLFRRVDRG